MKRVLKILLSTLLMSAMLASALPAVSAKGYDNTIEVKISGIDTKTDNGYFFVYPNKTDSVRRIKADEYNFRNVKIFVFDKDGKMIEAGENMIANSATQSGSIQEYLSIPAGGFAFAFKSGGSPELTRCYAAVTENAMHYNSTISVIQDAKGSYNDTHVTVEYNNLKKSPDAKKYLFIGNSATYVNGTPLKFKGLALAAGKDVDVEYGTFGSSYLSEFANENHQYGISFRQKLRLKKYDYVVLQDAGSCIYYNTQPAVKKLLPLIEANGAEALLYMRYSASSTPAGRIEGAQQHFDNYSKISEEFGLPYAPAALAYVICTEKYPDIDLYSDDNSHHSKEGSYLIACTMLMSYLGVDPRGNSYDAQLGETAAKLQECAYIACTEGYEFDKKPTKADEFTDKNGNICRRCDRELAFEVTDGEILGVGNGDPVSLEADKHLEGEALRIVGDASLTVTKDGKKEPYVILRDAKEAKVFVAEGIVDSQFKGTEFEPKQPFYEDEHRHIWCFTAPGEKDEEIVIEGEIENAKEYTFIEFERLCGEFEISLNGEVIGTSFKGKMYQTLTHYQTAPWRFNCTFKEGKNHLLVKMKGSNTKPLGIFGSFGILIGKKVKPTWKRSTFYGRARVFVRASGKKMPTLICK